MHILHLEDNPADAELVRMALARSGLACEIEVVRGRDAYLNALARRPYDVVLSDGNIPGYDGASALAAARAASPGTPFIFVSGHISDTSRFDASVTRIGKHELTRLRAIIEQRTLHAPHPPADAARDSYVRGMEYLVNVVQQLSLARTFSAITMIVRHAARELVAADGATFVLKEGDQCYYADEEAIAPLWKGRRFPMSACISGWAMQNGRTAVIPDIRKDDRIPQDAYQPTFVKSLVMTPIRSTAPIGAIGVYWASTRSASPEEIALLRALADSTSVAIESAGILAMLEQRVAERTQELKSRGTELEFLNGELEAFSYSVAHDLRAPLGVVEGFSDALLEASTALSQETRNSLGHIRNAALRMRRLIDDLLGLAKVARAPMAPSRVDLSALAHEITDVLRSRDPTRAVEVVIAETLTARGDPGLLRVLLENLLSNAWKFTSKTSSARIEVGLETDPDGCQSFFVRDNGAGFDMRYAAKLFGPFQRLHEDADFPGTGIGLATVRRIVHRHGGEIHATGAIGRGACFGFTLRPSPPGSASLT